MMRDRRARCLAIGIVLGVTTGCGVGTDDAGAAPKGQLVVYSSLDREFSEPVLQAYEQEAGIKVLPKFDVESTQTVGLTNQIIT
jgi:iron(III) transport system substrate-binding protein